MAEAPDRHMVTSTGVQTPGSTPAEVRETIRETRSRLSNELRQTSAHIHDLTHAESGDVAKRDSGILGAATRTLAGVGKARRVWRAAGRAGVAGNVALVAVVVTIAALALVRARRRAGRLPHGSLAL